MPHIRLLVYSGVARRFLCLRSVILSNRGHVGLRHTACKRGIQLWRTLNRMRFHDLTASVPPSHSCGPYWVCGCCICLQAGFSAFYALSVRYVLVAAVLMYRHLRGVALRVESVGLVNIDSFTNGWGNKSLHRLWSPLLRGLGNDQIVWAWCFDGLGLPLLGMEF